MEEVGWAERATPISMLRPYDNGVLDSGTALLKFTKIGVGIQKFMVFLKLIEMFVEEYEEIMDLLLKIEKDGGRKICFRANRRRD